jgi:hypothetical protein
METDHFKIYKLRNIMYWLKDRIVTFLFGSEIDLFENHLSDNINN